MNLDLEVTSGPVQYLTVPATGVTEKLMTGGAILMGFALAESTGAAAATVNITDGGNLVVPIALAAGATTREWFGPQGIECRSDITITVVAGSVAGAVFALY